MNWHENSLVLNEALSTNSTLLELAQQNKDLPQLYSVIARHQTAGRGQRGNSWSVSPDASLTFSFLIRSAGLLPQEQYAVSELAAYATLKTLAHYMSEEQKGQLTIKWPNDIYYQDKKIAGILIEHSITGKHIDFSVVGIGININEDTFPTELPNPISLKQITGSSFPVEEVHKHLMHFVEGLLPDFMLGHFRETHERYMWHLYCRKGYHTYQDKEGVFKAQIKDVLPSGLLVLLREDGEERSYAFKEVSLLHVAKLKNSCID